MRRRWTVLHRYSAPAFVGFLVAASVSAAGAQSAAPTVTRLLSIDSADVHFVAASPDGRWIAYDQSRSASTSDLFVRPASGGPATLLTPRSSTGIEWPRFSPTGDRIVYRSMTSTSSGSDAYIMGVPFDARTGQATGAPRQVTLDAVGKGSNAMAISPDGKWIAYVACCDTRRLRIVPIT